MDVMDRAGIEMRLFGNCITRMIVDAHGSVLGIVGNQGVKIVLWSAQILEHIKVCTMPLYWRKERGHGRLGVTLMLLRGICRHH